MSQLRCPSCGCTVSLPEDGAEGPLPCPQCQVAMLPSASAPAPSGVSTAVKIWLSVLLLALAAYGGYTLWGVLKNSRQVARDNTLPEVWNEGFRVGDFELVDSNGKPFRPEDMKGKVWIASFFFTTCRSGCLRLNESIAKLITEDLKDVPVHFVSISVDPEKDTPEKMKDYADGHFSAAYKSEGDRWLFVTDPKGRESAVEAISKVNFRVPFAKLTHNSDYLLVDQNGVVRGKYSPGMESEVRAMKKKIEELLANPPRGETE